MIHVYYYNGTEKQKNKINEQKQSKQEPVSDGYSKIKITVATSAVASNWNRMELQL